MSWKNFRPNRAFAAHVISAARGKQFTLAQAYRLYAAKHSQMRGMRHNMNWTDTSWIKMNVRNNLAAGVQKGLFKRLRPGRFRASGALGGGAYGAYAPGHAFFGNQYTKLGKRSVGALAKHGRALSKAARGWKIFDKIGRGVR